MQQSITSPFGLNMEVESGIVLHPEAQTQLLLAVAELMREYELTKMIVMFSRAVAEPPAPEVSSVPPADGESAAAASGSTEPPAVEPAPEAPAVAASEPPPAETVVPASEPVAAQPEVKTQLVEGPLGCTVIEPVVASAESVVPPAAPAEPATAPELPPPAAAPATADITAAPEPPPAAPAPDAKAVDKAAGQPE